MSLQRLSIFLLCILLNACSNKLEPSEDELEATLEQSLPGYFSLYDFEIEVSQNLGNEVDPVYSTRFQATVKTKEDLFSIVEGGKDFVLVAEKTEKGAKTEVYGKITSKLFQGKWQSTLNIEGNPFSNTGTPKSQISGGQVLVAGSSEAEAHLEHLRKEAEARLENLRKEAENLKNSFVGRWITQNGGDWYDYNSDDSFVYTSLGNGERSYGHWLIHDGVLILTWSKGFVERKKIVQPPNGTNYKIESNGAIYLFRRVSN